MLCSRLPRAVSDVRSEVQFMLKMLHRESSTLGDPLAKVAPVGSNHDQQPLQEKSNPVTIQNMEQPVPLPASGNNTNLYQQIGQVIAV